MGNLGPEELAAAALASTLCNVTGMSFSVGLSSAITTLTGQARGELILKGKTMVMRRKSLETTSREKNQTHGENHHERKIGEESTPLLPNGTVTVTVTVTGNGTGTGTGEHLTLSYDTALAVAGAVAHHTIDSSTTAAAASPIQPLVFLYRGIIIQLAFVIPIGLWWIKGIQPLFLALGQEPELSIMSASYLRVLTPGLWAYSINWTLTSWLQAIAIADVPAWAALVGFLSHVPFNILFVHVLGFGYLGVAMATVMFQVLQPIIMCGYLFGTARGRARVLEATGAKAVGRTHLTFWPEAYAAVTSIAGIKQYLSLALPGVVIISEWWASECVVSFHMFIG